MNIKLNNWAVGGNDDIYTPPERQYRYLLGFAQNHPILGSREIQTSYIVKVEGNLVTTYSGSVYELGEPDPNFVQWCKDNGCYVPTKECPIKFK